MKVLITGGMGVIGAEATRKFVLEGHRPVIYARRRDERLIADVLDREGRMTRNVAALRDLLLEAVGEAPAAAHVGNARLRGDGEAGGHPLRPEHAHHLGHAGSLAAEQVATLARALREVHHPGVGERVGHVCTIWRAARGCIRGEGLHFRVQNC